MTSKETLTPEGKKMTPAVAVMRSARSSVDPALFDRLTNRVVEDYGTDRDYAERVVEQALAFLHACALDPDRPLVPSTPVDWGWHAFVLHTKEYAAFCRTYAGRFVHHVPDDTPPSPTVGADVRLRTLEAIERAGYAVDRELWPLDDAKCSKCSASGKDGDENTETQLPS